MPAKKENKALMDITQTTNNSAKFNQQQHDECISTNYKEIASKVVDLQR